MALLQTDHDNVAWLTGSPLSRHASPSNASRTSASISLHRSDRELRDIGITRYEIEFVLRQSPWR
jgi:hypothetical protein